MRASRRGLVDLIVMIVMIVFLLGMGTLAFITYEKAQKERSYLAALREIPARQKAEIDSVKARYATLSNQIGFKGAAAFSSPERIQDALKDGTNLQADYYSITATGDGPLSGVEGGTVRGTSRGADPLYAEAHLASRTLRGAIGAQDNAINHVAGSVTPAILQQRALQRRLRNEAAAERTTASNESYEAAKAKAYTAGENIKSSSQNLTGQANTLATELAEENAVFLRLDSSEIRDARERAFAMSRQAADERRRAIEAQEAFRLKSDSRRSDDSRDPDGMVFLVDEVSGYVWINIGQGAGVQLDQTFQVVRADPSRGSEISIAEIRVREILRGNIARCRVDALEDADRYPRAGDLVRNPNFTARQYQRWALVGSFGGEHSRFTRQQLTDILRRTGFRVYETVDRNVDAVIIGGNWMSDPEWVKAEDMRLSVETYSEEEVLYFLGIIGPESRD